MERLDRHEQVLGRPHLGRGTGERTLWIHEVGGAVGGAALLAGIAILVGGAALRAAAAHEAVGEEHSGDRVEELPHVARYDEAAVAERLP